MITDWLDPVSYKLGQAAGGGGGGNPNHVETINGTLSSPWDSIDPVALHQSVLTGDANVSLDIDATALGFGHVYIPMSQYRQTYIDFSGVSTAGADVTNWTALVVSYARETGAFGNVYLLQSGAVTDMSQYASMLPTALTINYHPLP